MLKIYQFTVVIFDTYHRKHIGLYIYIMRECFTNVYTIKSTDDFTHTHTHAHARTHTHKLSYSNIIIKVLKRNININMDISYFDF